MHSSIIFSTPMSVQTASVRTSNNSALTRESGGQWTAMPEMCARPRFGAANYY